MKVWITKYALTVGIFEVDAEPFVDCPSMVRFERAGRRDYIGQANWFTVKHQAVEKAEKMRAEKLKKLKLQISKLESLKFQ